MNNINDNQFYDMFERNIQYGKKIKWHQMYISRHKDKNYDLVAKIFMTFKLLANLFTNIILINDKSNARKTQ